MWVRSTEINEILEPKHIGAFCPSSKASKLWETVKLTLAIYPKNQVISYQMSISATPKKKCTFLGTNIKILAHPKQKKCTLQEIPNV